MKREYTSTEVSKLADALKAEASLEEKKAKIKDFYSKHMAATIRDDANEYVGKLLLRFFFAVNIIVVVIIIIFAALDVINFFCQINDTEERFIDGSVLGGLVTATIAQAVAAYVAFTRVINS